MPNQNTKEEYAKQVCFFLAEMLRTRKISLNRASEIAEKVTQNISLIDSEAQFLKFVMQLTGEFQELLNLGTRVSNNIEVNKRLLMEAQVREFVVSFLPRDLKLAMHVLQSAVKESVHAEDLCRQFPQFQEFIKEKPWNQ